MAVPKTIWLYRITHINNLGYILKNGLYTRSSPKFDPDYISIGDSSLIDYRKNLDACNPPGGKLEDYVPFYLGPRSPMLYQIAKGYEDVVKHPQSDIVYLISSFEEIKKHQLEFFFTDGHARSETSNCYTQKEDFIKLDWDAINAKFWKSDETDLLRKQKKQAEFLIKTYVLVSCITHIGVYNEATKEKVLKIAEQQHLNFKIGVSPEKLYYDHL